MPSGRADRIARAYSSVCSRPGTTSGSYPAQDRGLGFDVGPLLEPAVQALLLALLQVIPHAGQRAAGVQLGYRVEAGREVLGGRPLPRLDLADHVVRDVGLGGQVLLGQA